ncbi:hypothetical protein NS355_09170 [Sphingomonas yabuuchiae]|uniref:Uncharacterized protein n=1 Tax=Sphingomonas yabuuchiae TaxID=172044 RepID=A0A147ISM7_9SPHN|nr:hypothetical protein NS355_09170 [Sphingomonas yabuuchiae]
MLLDNWPVFQRADPHHAIVGSAHSYWVGTEDERKAPHRIIIVKVTQDDTLFLLRRGANGDRLELQALSLSMGNDRAAKGSDRLAGWVLGAATQWGLSRGQQLRHHVLGAF